MKRLLKCCSCECGIWKQSHRRIGICQLISFLVFLSLSLSIYSILESITKMSAQDKIVMKDSNYKLWGEIPGQTESIINRDFYLNELQNGIEVIYYGQTPIVREVGPFSYQELQTFDDHQISDDNQYVDFNLWIRYQHNKNIGLDPQNTKVEIINLGAMGVWYQMQHARFSQVALQAFSQLIYGLESQMMKTAIAQSISYQQFKTQDQFNTIMKNSGINDKNKKDIIWNDSLYGWKQWTTLQHWIVAYQKGVFSDHAYFLKDYFDLEYNQISKILSNGQFRTYIDESVLVLDEYYCEQSQCTDEYLVAKQWTQCGITNSTPGGIIPGQESVVFLNQTFIGGGYPEIKYFQQNYFKQQISNDTKYDVDFDIEWTMNLFKHSQSGQHYLTDSDMILNIGNLQYIEQQMEQFELSKDQNDLLGISDRFGLSGDLDKTRVFYEYVKYMVNEFAVKQTQFNGTRGIAAMGTVGSQALYQEIQKIADFLKTDILSTILIKQSKSLNYTCGDLIFKSIQGISREQSEQLCKQNEQIEQLNKDSFVFLMDLCNNIYDTKFNDFYNKNKDILQKQIELIQLCDIHNNQTQNSFQQHMQYANDLLQSTYKCDYVCSKWELALKQWQNSYVTQNIPDYIQDQYEQSYSVNDWNPTLFPKKVEYLAVMEEFKDKLNNEIKYNYTEVQKLLSFDVLFNNIVYSSAFLLDDSEVFKQVFMRDNMKQLQFYLRYIIIEVGFGGFSHKRNAHELLWGYEDGFIHKLKTMDPQKGGDPSVQSIINLAGNDFTKQEAKSFRQQLNTGYNDKSKTRQYHKLYDHENIVVPIQKFNGKQVYMDYINPWKKQIKVKGTDSFQNPQIDQFIFITDLFRGSVMTLTDQVIEYQGIKTYGLQIEDRFFNKGEWNDDYFMDKYDGLLNLTSVKQLPIFTSLPYLQKLDPQLSHPIILDTQNKSTSFNKNRDQTFVHMEKYSGAALKAGIFLQQHYMLTNDKRELLVDCNQQDQLVPLFLLRRVGGWSDNAILNQLGDLKVAANLKIIFLVIFILFAIFYLVAFILSLKKIMNGSSDDVAQQRPLINSILKDGSDRQSTNMIKIQ